MTWIPLHTHSQYSVFSGISSLDEIVKHGKKQKSKGCALTDICNLSGAVDFFKLATKENLNPIIGLDMMVAPRSRFDKKRHPIHKPGYPLLLLAKNQEGYKNICKISSLGYTEGFYYTPRVDKEVLEQHRNGIICISGTFDSWLSTAIINNNGEEQEKEIEWLKKVYDNNLYFSIQRQVMSPQAITKDRIEGESWVYQTYLDRIKKEKFLNTNLIELSKKQSIPLVATNESYYTHREDWKAHEVFMNIQSGDPVETPIAGALSTGAKEPNSKRKILPTHEFYLKSTEDMEVLFQDLPNALKATEEISDLCQVHFDFQTKFYPVFVPPNLETKEWTEQSRAEAVNIFLKDLCDAGIKTRYHQKNLEKIQKKYPNENPIDVIKKRLERELSIITSQGMADYLLIVYDFIAWAKNRAIPVGPGRGSGAGSIVLYLIGITDIEPLQFDLFFERFINPERISYPDIDVDICMERRAEVIEYTLQKYGKENVAQIITFGTMKAKMVIRDVGRALSIPLAKVNQIVKLIPDDLGITLEKALSTDVELQTMSETDNDTKAIMKYARRLEGSIRNTGTHAAGIIISGDPLTEHIPICLVKDSTMPITQYAMKPVEAVGMLKIDFLGLKTLTAIQKAVEKIEKNYECTIDWGNLPLDDQTTFSLLNTGKTHGVFQLESGGMQTLVRNLHIDKFEEIIAVGALYRPGPMEMIPSFINRKHGRETIEVDHPLMADVIKETYGIMVYQEQVMQIASLLANYSLGEGDVLRRAMGKKDHKEMAKQREKFRLGVIEKGIDPEKGMEIFDKIEKFASYGFNKSHAAAYGYLIYVTGYLKANYSKEWLASLMTCDRDDLTKVAKHIREAESMHIPILAPDINESDTTFVPTKDGIRFAMSGIKGVGHGVVQIIVNEREQNGVFTDLYHFLTRINLKKVGKKMIAHLIEAGAFDFTLSNRQALLDNLEEMFKDAARMQEEKASGVLDLFANEQTTPKMFHPSTNHTDEMDLQIRLSKERELLGIYLSGHPLDQYSSVMDALGCTKLSTLLETDLKTPIQKTSGVIESVTVKTSQKSQRKFGIITVSDGIESIELPIWSDLYQQVGAFCKEGVCVGLIIEKEMEDKHAKWQCRHLKPLNEIESPELFEQTYQSIQKKIKSRKTQKLQDAKTNAMPPSLEIHCHAANMRLSHILKLKTILQKFPGPSPLIITFARDDKTIGIVHIDGKDGVELNPDLEQTCKNLPFLFRYRVIEKIP